ncbi:MAG: CDP-glycerol glycerophosphotransferase family protein [Deltaproteobacteria bacterium]|nr:CDP-glycerol glycerophosphotransferase family protein [Deltaproteobacteria bacterium]
MRRICLAIRARVAGDIAVAVFSSVRFLTEISLLAIGLLDPRAALRRRSCSPAKKVAFQAYSVHLAQFFQTTIAHLHTDPNVEVSFIILLHPQFPLRTLSELRAYARSVLGIPEKRIKLFWQVLWADFDLIIYTDVYARFPMRKTRKCLIAHGPGLMPRFFRKHPLRKTVFDFDLVAASGAYDLAILEEAVAGRQSPRLVSVGFPFLDRLFGESESREEFSRSQGFDPARPLVLFSPHWQTLNEEGSGQRVRDVIAALRAANVNVLIRPHVCSLNRTMARNVDWRSKLLALSENRAVRVDFNLDDIPALRHADAIVTDRSSRAFNAMLLAKPVILYPPEQGHGALESRRYNLMCSGSYMARTPSEITDLLRKPFASWRPRPDGTLVAAQCFAFPGHATEAFVQLIRREIGLRQNSRVNEAASL